MITEEFVKLVANMRRAQKAYQESRRYGDRELARELEWSVDKALQEINKERQSL